MEVTMNSNESVENYLETIHILSLKLPNVRSIDIVSETGFKKSSICVAMKHLREKEYITMNENGYIHLTPSGRDIALTIYERHQLISEWLMDIGVSKKTAIADACRIEHVISAESFLAMKKYLSRN